MIGVKSFLLMTVPAVLINYGPSIIFRKTIPDCEGYVHPMFEEVKQAFRDSLVGGLETGASFSVYYKGKPLVDLWGGFADLTSNKFWERDTLTQAWSVTKGVTAVAVALLVDRGHLDYNEYVYKYWPEFAQNGKTNITVAMLLSHQAGLTSLGTVIRLTDYKYNWSSVETILARQKPLWPPGEFFNYHVYTWGMYVDALVRKVDPKHRNISQFFREEVALPHDFDFYIGLPTDQFYRSTRGTYVATWKALVGTYLLQPDNWQEIPSIVRSNIMYDAVMVMDFALDYEVMNDPKVRSIGHSSFNGYGTARSLAMMYDYVANGGSIQGKKLLTEKQVTALKTPLTENMPYFTAPKDPRSVGMILETSLQGHPTVGHRGYGGQNAYADLHYKVGIAYLTNHNSIYNLKNDPRLNIYLEVLERCLEKFHEQNEEDT